MSPLISFTSDLTFDKELDLLLYKPLCDESVLPLQTENCSVCMFGWAVTSSLVWAKMKKNGVKCCSKDTAKRYHIGS